MHFLITGGTGFIGSRLAKRCLKDGHRVRILGLERTNAERQNRRRVEALGGESMIGSVTSSRLLAEALADVDSVFHLAAVQHEMHLPDEAYWSVNDVGTRRLVEACTRAEVARLVHASTIGVYGFTTSAVDEKTRPDPDNVYGQTKLAGERAVQDAGSELEAVVIRIPEVYGPGDRRLLKLFRMIDRGIFVLFGDGRNLHHPIYVEDLVDGLMAAVRVPSAAGETILLPGKEVITTRKMIEAITTAVGSKPLRFRLPLAPFVPLSILTEKVLRPLGVQPPLHRRRLDFFSKSFRIQSDKAEKLWGFKAKTDFIEGAHRTAEWYRSEELL